MNSKFPLFPEAASSFAHHVDTLYFFLIALSVFFSVLIFGLVLFFAFRYKRKPNAEDPKPMLGDLRLELTWSIIPLLITMVIFVWGGLLYYHQLTPPANAQEIFGIGKQWMWKFYHPEGRNEINELHVPVGRPTKVILTSEDVLHDLFIPAFRTKMDVLPGRYTQIWFTPTKTGTYHLFCAEYCGTKHADMKGTVTVMSPLEYQGWLNGELGQDRMDKTGKELFKQFACQTCHQDQSLSRGPSLTGVYDSMVLLNNGKTVKADADYLRESILKPKAKIVQGYDAIMPTYKGQISEEQLIQIIEYIKSLKEPQKEVN